MAKESNLSAAGTYAYDSVWMQSLVVNSEGVTVMLCCHFSVLLHFRKHEVWSHFENICLFGLGLCFGRLNDVV